MYTPWAIGTQDPCITYAQNYIETLWDLFASILMREVFLSDSTPSHEVHIV
jgi:hypothetical protein